MRHAAFMLMLMFAPFVGTSDPLYTLSSSSLRQFIRLLHTFAQWWLFYYYCIACVHECLCVCALCTDRQDWEKCSQAIVNKSTDFAEQSHNKYLNEMEISNKNRNKNHNIEFTARRESAVWLVICVSGLRVRVRAMQARTKWTCVMLAKRKQ